MAIDAKMSFITQLYADMADTLTVEQAQKMKEKALMILDHFDMKETAENEIEADNMLACYIAALRVECKSPRTIEHYEYEIKRMLEFVKTPTRRISVYHLRNYLAADKERGLKDTTMDNHRQIMIAYFNWLHREGLIDHNPTANLGVIKKAKREKKSYTQIEIEKLNKNCEKVRDRAIIHFIGSTGCRISEMTALNRENVNLDRLECVVRGKGDKERTVYMDEVTGMLIREYLESRKDNDPALFYGKVERIQPNGVRIMLKRLAARAGVEKVHPHKFRRTLATELARRGMPIQEISRILGHEKIDTTLKYVHQTDEDVKASYRRLA